MNRDRRGRRQWAHFLTGVLIGLVIVAPVLATPPDLPIAFNDDLRLYVLIGSGVLLIAALVMRLIRNRNRAEGVAVEIPRAYGMRFFRSDRPIALE
jgi:hypothetical protein